MSETSIGAGRRRRREYILTNEEVLVMVEAWRSASCPILRRRLSGRVVTSLGFLIQARLKPHRGKPIYDDLFQEGRLGVLRALQDFDPERSRNFFKFAKWHVQTRIRRALLREARRCEVPVSDPRPTEEQQAPSADLCLEQEEGHGTIMKALNFLPDKDRTVLLMRFGLNGDDPRTCQQVGTALGISRQRVQQIESKALRRLRRDSTICAYFCGVAW